jgi:hypothetical protein
MTATACDTVSHTGVIGALNRTKGFLGVSAEFADIAPRDALTNIREMNNEVLFPLGIKALSDIADDLLVLDEIRTRFRAANGRPLMGYVSWKAFVEKNSKFSIRTVQRRLVAGNLLMKASSSSGVHLSIGTCIFQETVTPLPSFVRLCAGKQARTRNVVEGSFLFPPSHFSRIMTTSLSDSNHGWGNSETDFPAPPSSPAVAFRSPDSFSVICFPLPFLHV